MPKNSITSVTLLQRRWSREIMCNFASDRPFHSLRPGEYFSHLIEQWLTYLIYFSLPLFDESVERKSVALVQEWSHGEYKECKIRERERERRAALLHRLLMRSEEHREMIDMRNVQVRVTQAAHSSILVQGVVVV